MSASGVCQGRDNMADIQACIQDVRKVLRDKVQMGRLPRFGQIWPNRRMV